MDDSSPGQEPEIIFHRPPRIEIYSVTGDQLDRIEESCGQVGHDLTFLIAAGSVAITLLATLLTTEASNLVQTIFIIIIVSCTLTSLYTGIRWVRRRRDVPKTLQVIRSKRSDDPLYPPEEHITAGREERVSPRLGQEISSSQQEGSAMARRAFYSFHYKPDSTRVAQVRQIGSIEGNRPANDNNWETITKGGDAAIKRWIAGQIKGKSCTVVLVGSNTANRKWINHEIVKSWDDGMGVVGIHIHGLKNLDGNIATKGKNPFDFITHSPTKKKLSSIVKCYNPAGSNSKERYAWISKHLANAVEEAIRIRNAN